MTTAHMAELTQFITYLNQGRFNSLNLECTVSLPDGKVGTVKKVERRGYVYVPGTATYEILPLTKE